MIEFFPYEGKSKSYQLDEFPGISYFSLLPGETLQNRNFSSVYNQVVQRALPQAGVAGGSEPCPTPSGNAEKVL